MAAVAAPATKILALYVAVHGADKCPRTRAILHRCNLNFLVGDFVFYFLVGGLLIHSDLQTQQYPLEGTLTVPMPDVTPGTNLHFVGPWAQTNVIPRHSRDTSGVR